MEMKTERLPVLKQFCFAVAIIILAVPVALYITLTMLKDIYWHGNPFVNFGGK